MAFSGQGNGFAVGRACNRKRRSMGIEGTGERVRSRIEQLCVFSAQNEIVRRDDVNERSRVRVIERPNARANDKRGQPKKKKKKRKKKIRRNEKKKKK